MSGWRDRLGPAGSLALVAALAVTLLAAVFALTRDRIAEQERRAALDRLGQILPAGGHDNDLLADRIWVSDAALGSADPLPVYRARQGDEPRALILEVVAPDGYSGPIRLLVGVAVDGHVTGVRVIRHAETPGLGDDIEVERSDWILGFTGLGPDRPPPERWRVRRDGGDFDQFTGATVTPRAVVAAVRNALDYANRHRDTLFAQPARAAP